MTEKVKEGTVTVPNKHIFYVAEVAPLSMLAVRLWNLDGNYFVEFFSLSPGENICGYTKYHILAENTGGKKIRVKLTPEALCKSTWKKLRLIFVHFTENNFVYKLAQRGEKAALEDVKKIRLVVGCSEGIKTVVLEENKISLRLLQELPYRLKLSITNTFEGKKDMFLDSVLTKIWLQ